MAKRIVAKIGEYTDKQSNQQKGEYTKLGVMLNNANGDYMLIDPCINLAGVLIKQNALAAKTGKDQRDMVIISIFDDDNQAQNQATQQSAPQQGGFQQQQPPRDANGFTEAQGGFRQQPTANGFQQG